MAAKAKKAKKTKDVKKARTHIGTIAVWCAYDKIVNVTDLKPNPDNPNVHPEEQIRALGKLIKYHGWRNPITISKRSGFVVRGHGRLTAAIQRGFSRVPVEYQEYKTDSDEVADLIADNKIAELSAIDEDLVLKLFDDIKNTGMDLELTGYLNSELDEMLNKMDKKKALAGRPEVEFTSEIMLEHNYIVLYFDNPFDWQVALDKFGLKKVRDLIPRRGQPVGIGRVLNGKDWIERFK